MNLTKHPHFALAPVLAALALGCTASAVTVYLPNGQFGTAAMTSGNGDETSLDQGWYAKNADNGTNTTINWSTGATVATPGVMTHTSNSGTKTRAGQYFSIPPALTGTGWSFEFVLGGTGTAELLRVWAGTLAGSPGGTAISTTGDSAPAAGLVDASGWIEIVNTGALSGVGPHSYAITQDLGNYDVMVIKFRGRSANTGTTYDDFAFVNPIPEPSSLVLLGLGGLALIRRRR